MAKKPLHWAPIKNIENTIFQKLANINPIIDYGDFENIFCESKMLKGPNTNTKTDQRSNLSSRRAFLVSLAIKSLEINGISAENIENIIKYKIHDLTYQDVINLQKIMPENEKEKNILVSIQKNKLSMNEQEMLKYLNIPKIQNIISILKFEKCFSEETELIVKSLKMIECSIMRILESKELKILLKIILEIGNAINSKYSHHPRFSPGFKLESLEAVNNYYGKKDQSILDFILRLTDKNDIDIDFLLEDLKPVHLVKNEDIGLIRAHINGFITEYSKIINLFNELNEPDQIIYKKFTLFACKRLKTLKEEYEKCFNYSLKMKTEFGEESTTPLSCILTSISNFLNKVKSRQAELNLL